LELTERLGVLLDLGRDCHVLDVAAGRGTSAAHLARRFGCRVTALDLATANVAQARITAEREGLEALVDVAVGDAEILPFDDDSFDVIVCECAFCTFPDKVAAVTEFSRVLRPGGRIGLSDVTRSGQLHDDLASVLAVAACIADAQPTETYVELLRTAGMTNSVIERHDESLHVLIDQVRTRLFAAQVLIGAGTIGLPVFDLTQGRAVLRWAAQAVEDGRLGYALVTATKTDAANPSAKADALQSRLLGLEMEVP
jgi:arsenite methyltransferase